MGLWYVFLLPSLVISLLFKLISGQGGAGPLGSISDYYDQAFGNPFLGYWKNPGNRNPFGTVLTGVGGGLPVGGYDSMAAYAGNTYLGDRPGPVAPSYAYDRLPNTFEQPGAYGGAGGFPVAAGLGGMMPFYGGAGGIAPPMYRAGMRGYGYGMGIGGMGMGYGVDSRTPADRLLQDLLPASYALKPFYP